MQMDQMTLMRFHELEYQLAWMIYMIGAIVGGRLVTQAGDEHELLDGELSSRVLQCMRIMDARLVQMGSGTPPLEPSERPLRGDLRDLTANG